MKQVFVSAVILINANNEILLTTRPVGKSMAGKWEFPGGKIEDGETPQIALKRELVEELNIEINIESLVQYDIVKYSYDDFNLEMPVFICRSWTGEIKMNENQNMNWFKKKDLNGIDIVDADVELLEKIMKDNL